MSWVRYGAGATLAALGGLAARYAMQRERLEKSWLHGIDQRLTLDGVVISQRHPDHVGGMSYVLRRTFLLSPDQREPMDRPAYVPAAMQHERAEVQLTTGYRTLRVGEELTIT